MRKARIMKRAILLILVVFLFFVGCAKNITEEKLERINIAFQEWVGYGPLYLAADKGFFKDEGIEVVFIDEQLDSARRDAFKRGMLDCEAGTIGLLVSKRAEDTPIVAVMEIDISLGGDGIVATEDIKRIEDILGKRVVFARDDVGETFISYIFHKKGLNMDDVTIIPSQSERVAQVFLDGEADVAVTWEPWLSIAAQRPGAHILITTKDEPGTIIDVLSVREDLLEDNPELIKKLMRGWFRAVKYYEEHPQEASGIIAKHYDLTPEQYRRRITGLGWSGYENQIEPKKLDEWFAVFNIIAEIKFINRRISKKPDAQEAIKRRLLRRLYEDSQ